jgi:flagellar biosynthesis activator protein FlaF
MTAMARTAYAGPGSPTRTARGLEYDLFARITHRLKQAQAGLPGSFPALARALHENLALWTVLAADVAEPGNILPATLRARIYYLAEFTRSQTRRVLGGGSGRMVDVLIEVNTSVMRGLRGEGDRR